MPLHRKNRAMGAPVKIFAEVLHFGGRVTAGMTRSELRIVPGVNICDGQSRPEIAAPHFETHRVGPVSCSPLCPRLLVNGGHTCPAYLCSRSTKRFSALRTGRSVHGQHVMINGIRVSFAETRDAFIFAQDRAEHALAMVTPTTRLTKG